MYKKQKSTKSGISLIVLVITIIVMIILAAAIIISLNNTGIIGRTSEAVLRQNLKNYQYQLELYLGDQLAQNPHYVKTTLKARKTADATQGILAIDTVINGIKDKDKDILIVDQGTLKMLSTASDEEKAVARSLGYEIYGEAPEMTAAEAYGDIEVTQTQAELQSYIECRAITDNVVASTDGTSNIVKTAKITGVNYSKLNDKNSSMAKKFIIPYEVVIGGQKYIVTEIAANAFNNGKYTCLSYIKEIVIPNSITTIDTNAFYEMRFDKVTIPKKLKTIGDYAFFGCGQITDINIPNGLTSIGESAFATSGITSITIPSSVTSVGMHAFFNCVSLTTAVIDGEMGEFMFDGCRNLNNVSIGNGITEIPFKAFYGCYRISNLVIPSSVETIGEQAFYEFTGNITLPSSVKTIGDMAFYGFTGNITLPSSVETIGCWAFNTHGGTVTVPDCSYFEKMEDRPDNVINTSGENCKDSAGGYGGYGGYGSYGSNY